VLRLLLVTLLTTLVGCAQTSPPPASVEGTRARLAQVESTAVAAQARDQLRLAWDKFRSAEAAAAAGSAERARRFAEQAEVHADIAETMTLTVQARDVLKEVRLSVRMLREEIERVYPSGR
jgi:hypothetical protein